jgi:hypothetical protein
MVPSATNSILIRNRLIFRAESSLIQSSCRSFIRVIVPYERGYETSGSPLRFMLRRSDNSNKGTTARLNETRFGPKKKSSPIYLGPNNLDTFWCAGCVTQNVFTKRRFFLIRHYVQPCLSKNHKYTFYTIKSSLTLAYYSEPL